MLAARLCEREFACADLGHALRRKRAVEISLSMGKKPRASLPAQNDGDWKRTKRTYEFLSNEHVSHGRLLSGHVAQTARRAAAYEEVLAVQDTTFLRYERSRKLEGLGRISGSDAHQGMCVHSALVVGWADRQVLGVANQQVWSRPPARRPKRETPGARKRRSRESEKWLRGVQEVNEALRTDEGEGPRITHVMDREGDTFEVLELADELQDDYVVRAARNRLLDELDDETSRYSLSEVRQAPMLFEDTLRLPRRSGRRKRAERDAHVQVRTLCVTLRPPKNRDRLGESLRTNLVAVLEPAPPEGEEPIEWFLLTSHPIDTREQVLEVIARYAARWLIEELHMGIKTGCAHEQRQLQSARGLMNHLAMSTVVAWVLMRLRDLARRTPSPPASEVLTSSELTVLRELKPRLGTAPSTRDVFRAIAALGGFLGRKADGEPGWRTLWRGYEELQATVRGYETALRMHSIGSRKGDELRER